MEKKVSEVLYGNIHTLMQRSYEVILSGDNFSRGRSSNPDFISNFDKIYSLKGNLMELSFYYKESLHWKENYEYDLNGNLISIVGYFPSGKIMRREVINYDNNNKPIEKNFWQRLERQDDLPHKQRTVLEYNEKGQLTKELCMHSGTNSFDEEYIYMYDQKKRSITQQTYRKKNELKEQFIYFYNEDDTLAKEIYSNSDCKIEHSYIYDQNRNVVEKLIDKKVAKTYKYTYDNMGNWIKKTQYSSEKPENIIFRNIEYWHM